MNENANRAELYRVERRITERRRRIVRLAARKR